jgi:hypothetical protein
LSSDKGVTLGFERRIFRRQLFDDEALQIARLSESGPLGKE